MFKLLAFGAGTGAGIQAWRNFPPDGPVTADALALVFIVGLLLAFLGGLWWGRGKRGAYASANASAEASASAESASVATNTVNLAVVVPGGASAASAGRVPTSAAPWLLDASDRAEVDIANDLEGIDVSELGFEDSTPEAAR